VKRTFLIDTDTASDDAVALMMALDHPEVDVAAITVGWGNVPVDQGVQNALFVTELCGAEVAVYRGADRPLARPPVHAQFFHGQDGLGDHGYAPRRRAAAGGDGVEAIIATIHEHPGLVVVTLGPLTNMALALGRDPSIAEKVGRCVVMGGAACTVGNVSPAAEYNVWADPEAARAVFRSPLPIEMVGWELCRGAANLTDDEIGLVRGFATPRALFAIDCNSHAIAANRGQSGDPGLALPDPVAMAVALEPSIVSRRSQHRVDVEIASELTRGMTVVDALGVTHDERNRDAWADVLASRQNVTVCWSIDVLAWKAMLYEALRTGASASSGSETRTSAAAKNAPARSTPSA
jgi:purine nucleosidase